MKKTNCEKNIEKMITIWLVICGKNKKEYKKETKRVQKVNADNITTKLKTEAKVWFIEILSY